jgi:hypothetical protein
MEVPGLEAFQTWRRCVAARRMMGAVAFSLRRVVATVARRTILLVDGKAAEARPKVDEVDA